jgi:hypothetical protein
MAFAVAAATAPVRSARGETLPPSDARRPVALRATGCATLDVTTVQRIVGVELLVETTDDVDLADTIANVRCDEVAQTAVLVVVDGRSGTEVSRTLAFSAEHQRDRKVASRLVAIALAELVWASWSEAPSRQRRPREGPDPKAPGDDPDGAPDGASKPESPNATRPGETEIGAFVGAHAFPSPRTLVLAALGLRIGTTFVREHGPRPLLRLDVVGARGGRALPLGRVEATAFTARPAAGIAFARAPASFAGSVGVRAGLVALEGSPRDRDAAVGSRVTGVFLAPSATVEAGVRIHRARLFAEAEIGYTALRVRGTVDGGPGTGAEGLTLGGSIGAALTL